MPDLVCIGKNSSLLKGGLILNVNDKEALTVCGKEKNILGTYKGTWKRLIQSNSKKFSMGSGRGDWKRGCEGHKLPKESRQNSFCVSRAPIWQNCEGPSRRELRRPSRRLP